MSELNDSQKIDRMYTALLGDEELGVEGIAQKVKKNSEDIRKINKKIVYTSGFFAGIVVFLRWVGSKII